MASMVLMGKTNSINTTIHFNYRNYLSEGWNDLFLIRGLFINLKLFLFDHSLPLFIKGLWGGIFFIFLFLNYSLIKSYLLKAGNFGFFYIALYLGINGLSILFYANKYLYLLSILLIFTTPIFLAIKYKVFNDKRKDLLLNCFIIASLFQIAILDPSSSIPNAILFDYILILLIVVKQKNEIINFKWPSLVYILLIPLFYFQRMVIPPLLDRTTQVVNIKKRTLQKYQNTGNKIFSYNCNAQVDFIIETSIKGNRYLHNSLIGDSISITQNFILMP
jgi:hypothetical protein